MAPICYLPSPMQTRIQPPPNHSTTIQRATAGMVFRGATGHRTLANRGCCPRRGSAAPARPRRQLLPLSRRGVLLGVVEPARRSILDHPPAIALLIGPAEGRQRRSACGSCRCSRASSPPLRPRRLRVASGAIARPSVPRCSSPYPATAAGLILATPDAPLIAATALALYAVVRALEHPPRTPASFAWWIAAGVALGLALCSKYTPVVPAAAVCIALSSRADLRPRLREPGPWVASLLAAILFLPVVLWNSRHGWVSFYFQLRHGLTGPKSHALTAVLGREGEYFAGLAGLASPVLFVFLAVATARALSRGAASLHRGSARWSRPSPWPSSQTSALHRSAEANWAPPAFLPAIVLLATPPWGERATRWIHGGTVLAAAMTLLIYAQALVPILPLAPRRIPSRGPRDGRPSPRRSSAPGILGGSIAGDHLGSRGSIPGRRAAVVPRCAAPRDLLAEPRWPPEPVRHLARLHESRDARRQSSPGGGQHLGAPLRGGCPHAVFQGGAPG